MSGAIDVLVPLNSAVSTVAELVWGICLSCELFSTGFPHFVLQSGSYLNGKRRQTCTTNAASRHSLQGRWTANSASSSIPTTFGLSRKKGMRKAVRRSEGHRSGLSTELAGDKNMLRF